MAFLDSSLVALRESLEAFLLVGILSGIVVKLGAPKARAPILWGALAGLAASLLLGILANGVAHELYEDNEPLFEGLAALVACAVLVYMVLWMWRHTRGLMGTLHAKAKAAVAGDRPGLLFTLAFVAVLREGIETVLFVAGRLPEDGAGATLLAILVGIAASAVLAFLLFAGVLRLSLPKLFAATGAVLVVVGAGLLATAVHELSEPADEGGPGWFPESPVAWDLSATLPHECDGDATAACVAGGLLHAAVGYRAAPRWAEVGAWSALLTGFAVWGLAARRRPTAAKPDAVPAKA